ncbi:MAG: hypothetical protein SGI91_24435 [Alphaproteobacteria bacterium]|jgi:hypothetical protein|nr:hypothetical protein [Alphaproteobacteria bacterium]
MAIAKRPDRPTNALRTAILVLGMHRSGTSALARITNFLGAAMPRHLLPANKANPRGHWESAPLVALHDQLLAALDSSWDDWRTPGSRWKESDAAGRFAGRLRMAIDEEYGNAPLIVLKDPRICRTLPYWMSILEKSGIRSAPVIIVRNPLEVAESLRARDGMSFEKAMLLWLRHMLDAEFETRHLARNIVTFDALLEDWKLLAAQTAGRLGITWPRQPGDAGHDVREFLDLELHNHRATQAELEAHTEVPNWVKTAYRALTQLCDEPKGAEPKRELDRVRHAFSESAKIFGVEAFAQTAALKQAQIETAEAKKRADDADAVRADLAKTRETKNELTARLQTVEKDLAKTAAQATELQRAKHDLETALAAAGNYQQRTEEAERRAAALTKQVADLEKNRVAHETMKRVTTDAAELKTLAKRLTERTELIEGQLKTQLKKSDKTTADLETTRAELKAAMQNAMALSKDLAAAKEQAHTFETKAIKAAADAKRHQEALAPLKNRVAALEADDRTSQAEISELRAELAEAWSMTGSRFAGKQHQPVSVVVSSTADEEGSSAGLPALVPGGGHRVEDDLRFERMHVEQLERRLGSWMGLASAALRKVTRLGKAGRPKAPRKRISGHAVSST